MLISTVFACVLTAFMVEGDFGGLYSTIPEVEPSIVLF